jgi:TPR repeat protein
MAKGAAHHFKLAADKGIAQAQCHNAICLINGDAVNRNVGNEFQDCELAAEKGSPDGQFAVHAWQRMESECFHPSISTFEFNIMNDVPISLPKVPFVSDGLHRLNLEYTSISRLPLNFSRNRQIQTIQMA